MKKIRYFFAVPLIILVCFLVSIDVSAETGKTGKLEFTSEVKCYMEFNYYLGNSNNLLIILDNKNDYTYRMDIPEGEYSLDFFNLFSYGKDEIEYPDKLRVEVGKETKILVKFKEKKEDKQESLSTEKPKIKETSGTGKKNDSSIWFVYIAIIAAVILIILKIKGRLRK